MVKLFRLLFGSRKLPVRLCWRNSKIISDRRLWKIIAPKFWKQKVRWYFSPSKHRMLPFNVLSVCFNVGSDLQQLNAPPHRSGVMQQSLPMMKVYSCVFVYSEKLYLAWSGHVRHSQAIEKAQNQFKFASMQLAFSSSKPAPHLATVK